MKKPLGILGLANKAGAVASGTNNVLNAVRSGKARLVILANDISDNTAKLLTNKASFRGIRLMRLPVTMDELGHALGKKGLSSAAFTDESFIVALMRQLPESPPGSGEIKPLNKNTGYSNHMEE